MKKMTDFEGMLHVTITYRIFDEWYDDNRYYVMENEDKQNEFIHTVCEELKNDFSKYNDVEIEAVWVATNFRDEVGDIVFGKYPHETFEESMWNEYERYFIKREF